MAYSVDIEYANHTDCDTKLAALLNAASITTYHESNIVKIGNDRYLIYIVYE